MRCPECSQRNSVAAKKCAACGSSLRRKPLPMGFKVFIGVFVGLIFVFCLAALSTTLVSPDKSLINAATVLTSKSTSADQMMNNYKRFDQSMRSFLQKHGSLSNDELSNKLAGCLPKSLYEDHVFELLPNLKLIEVDTALNASNYLVLLTNGKTEVLPIIGLDVYDANSFLPQTDKNHNGKEDEGQLLVLLGHTANMHGHQPKVKVIRLSSTLQSDRVVDLSDTVVPKLYGEGTAKFAPNQKDIEMSISLFSCGQEQQLFSSQQLKSSLPVDNESLYEQLIWQNDTYTLRAQPGNSKLFALFAAASALKNHHKLSRLHSYISNSAKQTIEQSPIVSSEQGFTIRAYRGGKKAGGANVYELKDNITRILVELRPIKKSGSQTSWFVNSLSISHVATPALDTAGAAITKETVKPVTPETQKAPEKSSKIKAPQPAASPAPVMPSQATTQDIQSKKAKEIEIPKTETKEKVLSQASFVPDLKSYVKIRSGPGTSFNSVQDVNPENTSIAIIGKEAGWYKVRINNKEGYVFAGLVNSHKNGYTNKTAKQNASIKDEQEHTIGHVRNGEHVILLSGLEKGSYKVMLCNGKIGYLSKESFESSNTNNNVNPISNTGAIYASKPKPNKAKASRKPQPSTNTPPPSVP